MRRLTDHIEKIISDRTSWDRLGRMLLETGQVNTAKELYLALLVKEMGERDRKIYYNQLALIRDQRDQYTEGMAYSQQAIFIDENILSPNNPRLATCYNNVGLLYAHIWESFVNHCTISTNLLLFIKIPISDNHPDLATSFSNIGMVYDHVGKYSQAMSYHNKTLAIQENNLPDGHPMLTIFYNYIDVVYHRMAEYSQVLSYYSKALAIQEHILSGNQIHLATSYNKIGST